jgi:hypothetical protein
VTPVPGLSTRWVDSAAVIPGDRLEVRVAVLDIAFASGPKFGATERFLGANAGVLAAWVDHHRHPAWERWASDPRFVLVPNNVAHACPELVTPDVVTRAGQVGLLLAHADFDGMMSAVTWRLGGRSPYPEALEDARAADSPGRGHVLTARGARLVDALDQAKERLHTPERHDLMTRVADALVTGTESPALTALVDDLASRAHTTREKAQGLLGGGKEEFTGVYVVRHPGNLSGRVKKAILLLAEERADVGAVVEGAGPFHVTAATFREDIDLSEVSLLSAGRSDYRFVNRIADPVPVLKALSLLARPYG